MEETKTPYYLWIENIKGFSSVKGHEGWIPILSYSFDPDDGSGIHRTQPLTKFIFFKSPDDGNNIAFRLAERAHFSEMFKAAKLDQVFRPKAPATLFEVERVMIFDVQVRDSDFLFTLALDKYSLGPGYKEHSGGGSGAPPK